MPGEIYFDEEDDEQRLREAVERGVRDGLGARRQPRTPGYTSCLGCLLLLLPFLVIGQCASAFDSVGPRTVETGPRK
ncbi:hypothetical protein N8607_00065 [bacterium]|nr:hypothetical protein [bacterium]